MTTRRAGVIVAGGISSANFTGGAFRYPVVTNNGDVYVFYVDQLSDVSYRKSVDGGLSFRDPVVLNAGSTTQLAVWYDRWSGIAADLIHIAWTDSGDDDIHYINIDTADSDSASSPTIVAAGTSTASGGSLSITRARGGNLVVAGSIDAGAEDGAWKSTDVGANWSAIADPSEGATTDQYLLMPGWNADNQDVMLFFWDSDTGSHEISVKRYDDSGDSWGETSIATSMVDTIPSASFPHMAAAVDHANSQNVFIAWSAVDTASASLRCWTVTDSAITEKTAVVSSSTDDQGLAALAINSVTGHWHAYYCGATDGSETFETAVNVYVKVSQDGGTTWGSETAVTNEAINVASIFTSLYLSTLPPVHIYNDQTLDELILSVELARPRASFNLGI